MIENEGAHKIYFPLENKIAKIFLQNFSSNL